MSPGRAARLSTASLAALLVGVCLVALAPIADGDIFWHLAAGRDMVRTGHWLKSDPFTASAFGRPWIDVHWLFQLGAYAVESLGGLRGLVLVKAALLAVGAAILWRTVVRTAEPDGGIAAPAAVMLLAGVFFGRHWLLVRPVIVSLVFLALFFAILERHRQTARGRALAWLALLQLLWVNCQGLSALGPAMVAAYALTARLSHRPWRPLALVFAVCVVASFATPYGIDGTLLPLKLLLRISPGAENVFAGQVAENIPPFILERTSPAEVWHVKWFLVILSASFVVARREVSGARALLTLMLVPLALAANRNVLLLYWLCIPIAVLNLAPLVGRVSKRWPTPFAVACVGALLVELGFAATAFRREPTVATPTPFRFPVESVRLIAARPGPDTIFAPDHQGGYLTWTLGSAHKPYIDTRLILHTGSEFSEYLSLLSDPPLFDAFATRETLDWVVLPTAFPDRYLGLLGHLLKSRDWTLVFTDGSESLFARGGIGASVDLGDAATTDAILATLTTRYAARPDLLAPARLNLAKLELVAGYTREGQRALAGLDTHDARALRARCHFLAGELDEAEHIALALVAQDPDDVHSLDLLARISFRRNQQAAGRAYLRRALDADPFDDEARSLIGGAGSTTP